MSRYRLVLSALLMVGLLSFAPGAGAQTAPGLAAPPQAPHPPAHVRLQDFRGSLVSLGANALTLKLADGTTQVFTLGAGATLSAPGKSGTATAAEVAAASLVRVTAQQAAAGGPWSVVRVLIEDHRRVSTAPDPLARKTAQEAPSGLVTAYSPGASLTLQLPDGQTATYPLNSATRLLPPGHSAELAVGARVTLLAGPGAAAGDPAWGVIVLPASQP